MDLRSAWPAIPNRIQIDDGSEPVKKLIKFLFLLIMLVVILTVIAVFTLPADLALRWTLPATSPLRLEGVGGRAIAGNAERALLQGQSIGRLEWQVEPMQLFQGNVRGTVSATDTEINATAHFSVNWRKDGAIESVVADMPARLLAPALDIPALIPTGRLIANVPRVGVRGGFLTDAEGKIRWKDAGLLGAAQASIGEIEIEFHNTDRGTIEGTARDIGGPLMVDGKFSIEDQDYRAEVRLDGRGENVQAVRDALRYVGQPQADGTTLLVISGRLKPLL